MEAAGTLLSRLTAASKHNKAGLRSGRGRELPSGLGGGGHRSNASQGSWRKISKTDMSRGGVNSNFLFF